MSRKGRNDLETSLDDRMDLKKSCPKKNNYGTKAIKHKNICHGKWVYGRGREFKSKT